MTNTLPSGKSAPHSVLAAEHLGQAIQCERKSQGLTQADVAGLAGTGVRFIVDLEKGKPTIQIGKALEVLQLLGLELSLRKKGEQ